MMIELIAPIMSAASKAIASAVRHASDGDMAKAERVVKRFVAATQAELDRDEQDAMSALGARFDD